MKMLIAVILLSCSLSSQAGDIATFTGRYYLIQIEKPCCHQPASCDHVRFYAISLTNNGTFELNGKIIKIPGVQGAIGYQFFHGEYSYRLLPDIATLNYWHFTVINSGKLVAEDSGKMKEISLTR